MAEVYSPHIGAQREQIAKAMLLPGDPLRAKAIAETYLESPACFNTIRNMFGYTGFYKGRRVSVMGSGMGIPSATLYVHELFNVFGVESLIRIGTAGGLAEHVKLRDVIIAMSASTDSNFSAQYCYPGLLAPTADYDLLRTAVAKAEAARKNVAVGSVFTTDTFYNAAPQVNEKGRELGLLCVEMETAGIYWEAMASHKRALSILTISDHLFTHEEIPPLERQNELNDMIKIALETAWEFAE